MVDLRNHKALIREAVDFVSRRDANWNWKLVRVNKGSIIIRWGYLDYLGVKESFRIEAFMDGDTLVLAGYDPGVTTLRSSLVTMVGMDLWCDCKLTTDGIRLAVCGLASHAMNTF